MHIISIILLGVAANLDNLGIGLSYGIRKIKVPLSSNLIIAVISGIATVLSATGGHLITHLLPAKASNIFGGAIVVLVGLGVIISYKRACGKNSSVDKINYKTKVSNLKIIVQKPQKADLDYSGHISFEEAILLGSALAVNCLATGLGAGLTGLNVAGLAWSVTLFSLLTIITGVQIGKRFASLLFGDRAPLVAGVILIIIGLYEIFI